MTVPTWLFALAFLAATVPLLLVPRWFFVSLQRYKLWRLRDELADQVFAGNLPDNDVVGHLIKNAQRSIVHARRLNPIDALVLRASARRWSPEMREALRPVQPAGYDDLDRRQQEMVDGYQADLRGLNLRTFILCSWSGMLVGGVVLAVTLAHALLRSRRTASESVTKYTKTHVEHDVRAGFRIDPEVLRAFGSDKETDLIEAAA